jgi:hypothetical protein
MVSGVCGNKPVGAAIDNVPACASRVLWGLLLPAVGLSIVIKQTVLLICC